ncbi:conserved protein of unknown function [Candidatus Filomicrobium marinum]|uniref:Beta-lactamase hydrolase-like protein phosphatase-like domain-containing protein n=3 Tax=Hyphomicrobiaceae TaxID=45401 RepID=A0A0D6JIP2_9HYPH|nr:conserved protein of unknown function [Candidatus Filomicrobium marinum]CPR21169.1 conserved protein of unknown function [Candidatus Filomicrobium marinum]SDP24663.1 TIGR01244 family protein [Filomicrobium insigne]
MQNLITINKDFAVAKSEPHPEQLKEFAADGFRSIVNLQPKEEKQKIPEDVERRLAKEAGLTYRHIAVSRNELDSQVVEKFRQEVETLPKPVVVHCASGKRAGALTMMHVGVTTNQSGEETLQHAKAIGFDCDTPQLANFIRDYVDRARDA